MKLAGEASPFAVIVSLTHSIAVGWSKNGVSVNAIAPGVFRTALNAELLDNTPRGREFLIRTPMERFGKTEQLVAAAVYLAYDAASFVTEQPWSSMEAFWPATSINSCAQRKE